MSIAVLSQLHDETRRLAIAGSHLANGDFRLNKLIAPLQKAGAKAPVFARVADAAQTLLDAPAQEASRALLDLSTLVSAILYTQGSTGIDGDLQDVATENIDLPTAEVSARLLKPLLEALTTTGSGRLEIMQEALDRGVFQDLRLVRHAVAAIDDRYSEIGEFITTRVLPLYGRAIYPWLRSSFKLKGGAGQVRRLQAMYSLDPAGTRELVLQALESGSAGQKVFAIECLRGSREHLAQLLSQTRARSKDVRDAALMAVAEIDDDAVTTAIKAALSDGDLDTAVRAAQRTKSTEILGYVIEEGHRLLEVLLGPAKQTVRDKAGQRMCTLLEFFAAKTDRESSRFLLHCFEQRKKLQAGPYGENVVLALASLFVYTNCKRGQEILIEAHASLDADLLGFSLLAAVQCRSPKEVYALYSPYCKTAGTRKRGRSKDARKQQTVSDIVAGIATRQASGENDGRDYYPSHRYGFNYSDLYQFVRFGPARLDPAWLDLAIERDDLDLVLPLARSKHKATVPYLQQKIDALLDQPPNKLDHEANEILQAMARIGHPKLTARYIRTLQKISEIKRDRWWYLATFLPIVNDLPQTAIAALEKNMPSFSDDLIEKITPYLDKLKSNQLAQANSQR